MIIRVWLVRHCVRWLSCQGLNPRPQPSRSYPIRSISRCFKTWVFTMMVAVGSPGLQEGEIREVYSAWKHQKLIWKGGKLCSDGTVIMIWLIRRMYVEYPVRDSIPGHNPLMVTPLYQLVFQNSRLYIWR